MESMTAIQLNAQIWQDMAAIADSEPLMKQLARYLKRLVAKKNNPSLMTKEEFFARIEKARQQKGRSFANVEELDRYIQSL